MQTSVLFEFRVVNNRLMQTFLYRHIVLLSVFVKRIWKMFTFETLPSILFSVTERGGHNPFGIVYPISFLLVKAAVHTADCFHHVEAAMMLRK